MLMRFDPFRDLDRLTQQAFGNGRNLATSLPMDAYRHADEFIVHFDLPGADPASIDLTVEKNVLTVKAARTWSRQEGDEWVIAERPQGTFTRQLFLGETLDAEGVRAAYENGVLTVRIPVAEKAKPRKVDIQVTTDGAKAVEATSSAA